MRTLLIKRADIHAPESMGLNDILCVGGQIVRISREINEKELKNILPDTEIYDALGMVCVPGIVDIHVHFNGAGGEGCPQFRTPPTQLTDLTRAGITTAVGLLGTDGITRSLNDLYMKARALQNEGVSTFIFTGSYQIPSPTLTGTVPLDIAIIDKVVGLKIAFSDHRSSHPSEQAFIDSVANSRLGGIIGGKSGKVMVHMGSPKDGLGKILEIISQTEIPLNQIIPTHLNRSPEVFEAAIEYGLMGGNVDVSAGVSPKYGFGGAVKPSRAIAKLLEAGINRNSLTMSSDGNGSMGVPNGDGTFKMLVSPVKAMFEEFRDMIMEGISIDTAVCVVSTNPAEHLALANKGRVKEGFDADMLFMDKNYSLKSVFAMGKKMVENDQPIIRGVFEV